VKIKRFLAAVLSPLGILGCDDKGDGSTAKPSQPEPHPSAVAPAITGPQVRVSVFANGKILVDGNPASLEAVDTRFAEIAKANGSVRYYREDINSAAPPASAMDVTKLVIKHRLPISFSSRPDFSDTIRPK
jgi:hypothetical protein